MHLVIEILLILSLYCRILKWKAKHPALNWIEKTILNFMNKSFCKGHFLFCDNVTMSDKFCHRALLIFGVTTKVIYIKNTMKNRNRRSIFFSIYNLNKYSDKQTGNWPIKHSTSRGGEKISEDKKSCENLKFWICITLFLLEVRKKKRAHCQLNTTVQVQMSTVRRGGGEKQSCYNLFPLLSKEQRKVIAQHLTTTFECLQKKKKSSSKCALQHNHLSA